MSDVFSPARRSEIMSHIRGANTGPERALRAAMWRAGLRGWRLHVRALPGRPDVVFGAVRLAVFVDGGFWHGHPKRFRPGISGRYWDEKIAGNVTRDRRNRAALRRAGWATIRLWDFDIVRAPDRAAERVRVRLSELALQRDSRAVG